MVCADKNALLQAYAAAVKEYRTIFALRQLFTAPRRVKELEDAHGDCDRRRRALQLHCEEHGC